MKEKKLTTNKSPLLIEDGGKSIITVPVAVKPPVVPKGYEIARIEVVLKKVAGVNPNPTQMIKKSVVTTKKTVSKATSAKAAPKKVVAKKAVAKKAVATKKVVKKK